MYYQRKQCTWMYPLEVMLNKSEAEWGKDKFQHWFRLSYSDQQVGGHRRSQNIAQIVAEGTKVVEIKWIFFSVCLVW